MKPPVKARFADIWPLFGFAGFGALGVYLGLVGNASERQTGWICALFFGALTLIFGAWELIKNQRLGGPIWKSVEIRGQKRQIWLLPASRWQNLFLGAVFLVIALVGAAIVLSSRSSINRLEMGVAGVVAAIFVAGLLWQSATKTRGIGLLPEGIMWRDIGLGDWLFDLDDQAERASVAPTVLALAQDPQSAKIRAQKARDLVRARFTETMGVVRGEVIASQTS